MATPATVNPFNFYPGRDGLPLQNGYLYFGEPFQDPELQPLQAYWDDANTQPAARPIRTINGYPARNGTPAQVFVAAQYSMRVRDSQGREVFYAPNVTAVDLGGGGLDIITASGGQTVVNLTNAAYTPGSNAIDVSLNGLILISGQDYFETGTTRITMASALSAGDQIRAFARSTFGLTQAVLSDWQAEVFDGDGTASQNFTLTRNPGAVANMDISVTIGGIGSTLRPLIDYTLSGQTVTITPAPAVGTDNVLIRYGRSLPQDALRGELASTASAADGDALVAVLQPFADAVPRSQHSKNVDVVNVCDFGADPTFTEDSSDAIERAINAFTQRYTAYPKHDMYSRGTLKATAPGRVIIVFPMGKYKITRRIDVTYRGFISFVGRGAVIANGNPVSVPDAMFDCRYSNEMSFDGLVFEAAYDFTHRFAACVYVGGSDDKVSDSPISAKAVHFFLCEFRNPSDSCINAVNDTGTFKASIDNSKIDGCFFAGGAVGLKYAGYECWLRDTNAASQTYAAVLLQDNASLSCSEFHVTNNEGAPAFLVDTDNTNIVLRSQSSYYEQCSYVLQVLGGSSAKSIVSHFSGGRMESCSSGLIALLNRQGVLTIDDVHVGNTVNSLSGAFNTAVSGANATLVLKQNQIATPYNGAIINTASWAGKIQRSGFLAGYPVNIGPTGVVSVYVDPAIGSDFNDGYASAGALATLGEAFRRINTSGTTIIYLASGPDATPRTYTCPSGFEMYAGRVVVTSWEKHAGSTTAINTRTILNCPINKLVVFWGLLELQSITVQGGRAASVYNGSLSLLSCAVPAAGANGAVFCRTGWVTVKDTTFSGAGTDVGVYVGDAFGAAAALYSGGGNTWGAVTKYAAYSGITTHITTTL